MQYCPNCKVKIRGNKAHCPLCERELVNIAVNVEADEAVVSTVVSDNFLAGQQCARHLVKSRHLAIQVTPHRIRRIVKTTAK